MKQLFTIQLLLVSTRYPKPWDTIQKIKSYQSLIYTNLVQLKKQLPVFKAYSIAQDQYFSQKFSFFLKKGLCCTIFTFLLEFQISNLQMKRNEVQSRISLYKTAVSFNKSNIEGLTADFSLSCQQVNNYIRLSYSLPIECHSYKQRNFVQHLLTCLQICQHLEINIVFHTSAMLQDKTGVKQQLSKRDLTVGDVMTYFVQAILLSENVNMTQTIAAFQKKCTSIHQAVKSLKERYSLQNRMGFWAKKFNQVLARQEQKSESVIVYFQTGNKQKQLNYKQKSKDKLFTSDLRMEKE